MKLKPFLLVFIVSIYITYVTASAGLVSSPTKIENVEERSTVCKQYGLYNPFNTDTTVTLEVQGDIRNFADITSIAPRLIPANTDQANNIPITICFTTPQISEKGLCEVKSKSYSGKIVVTEIPKSQPGSGSIAVASVASDLTLEVQCTGKVRNLVPLYVAIVVIIIAIIAVIFYLKKKKDTSSFKPVNSLSQKFK